jgi:putative ABC transport system permease protein
MIDLQEILMTTDIGLIYGLVAIGIYLTFRTINFADMTCDGSFVFGSSVCAMLIQCGANQYIAMIIALFAGGIAGLLTGILNVYCKISDLLSGIIVAFMLYSINLKVMGGLPNITLTDLDNQMTSSMIISIVIPISLIIVYLIFTNLGLALRAVGYNKTFSQIMGINQNIMTLCGLFISNALIGLGGAMFTQYQGFCDISQGKGTLIAGLAAVIIGENFFKFQKAGFLIISCVAGSILYRFFIMIALHSDFMQIETQDLNIVAGLIIIAMMLIRKERNRC